MNDLAPIASMNASAPPVARVPLAVVLPAYNEAGNLERLIREIFDVVPSDLIGEVIVVDDASDDGTPAEVKALVGHFPRLRYIRHASRILRFAESLRPASAGAPR